MTVDRQNRIILSVQFMQIMAELIKQEHLMEMDADFRNPVINNFASRISKDATMIQTHLSSICPNKNMEFKEEYTGEMYRVFRFFIGLPLPQLKEFMDNCERIQSEEEKNYELENAN